MDTTKRVAGAGGRRGPRRRAVAAAPPERGVRHAIDEHGVAEDAIHVVHHHLRLANASNARIYKLAWSDDRPMRVIATGNGLLSAAEGVQTRPYMVLGPFERVELLEDFGTRPAGSEVALVSREFAGLGMTDMMDMMDGMMGRGGGSDGMMGGGMMAAWAT